jgi:hypothetical protein
VETGDRIFPLNSGLNFEGGPRRPALDRRAPLGREPATRAWSAWSIWQHSGKGKVPRVGGNRELDYFNGGEAHLRRFTLP